MEELCRVYWGSHGCRKPRGHEGDCLCLCADERTWRDDVANAGAPPYYGPDTRFYGEDAVARGLPLLNA